jgi:hypothetical protein
VSPSSESPQAAANLPFEETEVAQRCDGVGKKKKKRAEGNFWEGKEVGRALSIPMLEDHDTQNETSNTPVASAFAHPIHDDGPRPEKEGSYFFQGATTAKQLVALPVRFRRVKKSR